MGFTLWRHQVSFEPALKWQYGALYLLFFAILMLTFIDRDGMPAPKITFLWSTKFLLFCWKGLFEGQVPLKLVNYWDFSWKILLYSIKKYYDLQIKSECRPINYICLIKSLSECLNDAKENTADAQWTNFNIKILTWLQG